LEARLKEAIENINPGQRVERISQQLKEIGEELNLKLD